MLEFEHDGAGSRGVERAGGERNGTATGRAAAVGVPDQPNVFYVGQVDGGVWTKEKSACLLGSLSNLVVLGVFRAISNAAPPSW